MGVADRDAHDWIEEELWLLRGAVEAEVPVFGICLGAQLLATALGGEVERRDTPEAAWLPLVRTEQAREDAIFAGWPDGGSALFLHRDEVVTLPVEAVPMLTGSDGVPAWRVGEHAYAVQFHPEVGADQLRRWAGEDAFTDLFEAADHELPELLAEAEERDAFVRATGTSLVGRWLDQVVGAEDPTPRVTPRE